MLKILTIFKKNKPKPAYNKPNNCMMALDQRWLFNGSLDRKSFLIFFFYFK